MKQYFVLFFLLFFSCQPTDLVLERGTLNTITDLKSSTINDTLNITYFDKSFILFEDYNALKSNVLVFLNKEKLKAYPYFKTINDVKKTDISLYKIYSQEDLLFIEKLFSENPIFKDFAIHLTSTFTISDWWNLRHAINFTNENLPDKFGESPIDLLAEFSAVKQSDLENSKSFNRLKLIGEMILDTGITDVMTEKTISAAGFIERYNYFFTRRNLAIPY